MRFKSLLFLLVTLMIGCGNSTNPPSANDTAILGIFHSNDIMGYLEPCG